jgi:hypothetical protein
MVNDSGVLTRKQRSGCAGRQQVFCFFGDVEKYNTVASGRQKAISAGSGVAAGSLARP